jgi:GNAT superfamily N-acetyltransferase
MAPGPRTEIEIRPEPSDSAVANELIEEFVSWAEATYGPYDRNAAPAHPHELAPPGGVFLVAWDGDAPVGCAALKRLDDRTGEVKRVHVADPARRRGAGRALMLALEGEGRARGYERLRLDIGDRQPEAMALYSSLGYVEIPDYNGNPYASFWFEKRL